MSKPDFPVVPGMFIIGFAVLNRNKQGTRLYRRYHDAVNASNGTVSNHCQKGGEVFPVYAFEVRK